jgi:ubiquitin carboxyl-terminal hydrolase 20/33
MERVLIVLMTWYYRISSRLEVFQDLSLPIPTRDELTAIRTADRYEVDDGKYPPGWVNWIWEWVKSFFWGPAPSLEDCFAAFFSTDELKG